MHCESGGFLEAELGCSHIAAMGHLINHPAKNQRANVQVLHFLWPDLLRAMILHLSTSNDIDFDLPNELKIPEQKLKLESALQQVATEINSIAVGCPWYLDSRYPAEIERGAGRRGNKKENESADGVVFLAKDSVAAVPGVALVTCRPVTAGEELLLDYRLERGSKRRQLSWYFPPQQ